ncbi:ATP-binding sensor histidine kinase [Ornithinibacillus caprae]|nr:ATP-binding sensor histidine kinase [Ornithinibacillus caprae]
MEKIPGYQMMIQQIEGESWSLYKALSEDDQRFVGVKKINNDLSEEYAAAETVHEYYLTKELVDVDILHPNKLERVGEKAFIITEYFDGYTLMDWMNKYGAMDIGTFLKMAIQLAGTIEKVHHKHIIHKSLHPKNILLESKTNHITLTAFHQATTLPTERHFPHVSPYQFKEKVAYMSPEQTGRMNRSMDYRADLYALGVIYYEMMIGEVPFKQLGPAEMIHAHLAKKPKSPQEINPKIPDTISRIILKLLAKNPDDRYQSANSLRTDLELCLKEFNQFGDISEFVLDRNSKQGIMEKQTKLYGRKEAINTLIDKFNDVQRGSNELILVPGPSGIGKTALVNELHKPLARDKGYFISGKFMKLKKQIPYAPFVQAFQELVNQILTEGSDRIQQWKRVLEEELGSNANVIANFIPEIEWIIGTQPNLTELPPQGVHNRFRQAIRKFVGIFAREDHPLVLFMDDLQWADAATLDLIDYLLCSSDIHHFLVVGAYRQDEIQVGHPFEAMLAKLEEESVPITEIPVTALKYGHIKQWINEMLSLDKGDEEFLAAFMYRVTQGNPLFMVQLFQTLHEESVFYFDASTAEWQANLTRLKEFSIKDDILEFMIRRIGKLPHETISVLQYASCFGNQFDLKSLSFLTRNSYVKMAELLWKGLEEGLIIPLDPSYKWVYPNERISFIDSNPPQYIFLHDKVQQAFYMTMSEERRIENHLNIGKELLKRYSAEKLEEHIFEIVNHLNISRDKLSDHERFGLIRWNWMAGERAKKSAASEAALEFFKVGHELLPKDRWQNHYELTFNLLLGLGETLYLNNLFEDAEKIFNELVQQAKSRLDQLTVYNLKIALYTHIHEVEKAVDTGLDGLKLFGWNIRKTPSKLSVGIEFLRTKLALAKKQTGDLLDLPFVKAKDHRQVLRTLINSNGPAYHVNQNLATVLMLRAIRFMLKYGDMDISALVYNNYALTLSAGFNDYNGSIYFGKLAMEHSEKYHDTSIKARVNFVYGSFVGHWKHHLKYSVEHLERSQQMCIESGNLHLAGANGAFIGLLLYIKGDQLKVVARGIERQLTFAKQHEYALTDNFLTEILYWIDIFSNEDSKLNWDYQEFAEDIPATIMHYTIRLQMTYLLNAKQKAMEAIEKIDHLVDQSHVLVITPDYYYYHALWLTRLIRTGDINISTGRKKLKRNLAKLKKWAIQSPVNYKHKYLLVKAEWEQCTKNDPSKIYSDSIESAIENGFLQDTAIAYECAGNYYKKQNMSIIATTYFSNAYVAYRKWGAERKASLLYQENLEFINTPKQENGIGYGEGLLDIDAALQAAAAISDEMRFEQLLAKAMRIVLTNAGAEYVCFLLNRDHKLQAAASNDVIGGVHVFEELKTLDEVYLSQTIVNYVYQSHKPVVLDNAFSQGDFIEDEYIKQSGVKSVLCLPLLYQNTLTGVLYLENNQSTHVFTEGRLELLSVIASQVAIAIENANLYANLEEKVTERTALLYEANKNLQQANESLEKSEENRRRMLSNITHDLRSPLAAVKGYIDIMLEGLLENPEQHYHYIKAAKSRIVSLDGLVQDLFDLAKLESGDITLSLEAVPIDRLFQRLCSQSEWEIHNSGLTFEWNIEDDEREVYPLVEVDVGRMEQVMANLVSNAIQHMEQGYIRISLDLKSKKEAIFVVEDQGVGIPEAEQPLIFERSYTKRRRGKEKGNGLGLAITKEIIQLHQGKIWVESKKGEGAKFYFSLPVVNIEPLYETEELFIRTGGKSLH